MLSYRWRRATMQKAAAISAQTDLEEGVLDRSTFVSPEIYKQEMETLFTRGA